LDDELNKVTYRGVKAKEAGSCCNKYGDAQEDQN
jgi:hypothetical protein